MNDSLAGAAHPSMEKLRTFGLGQLKEAEASVIEEHISQCQACCRTLADIGRDTFTDLLRVARQSSLGEDATIAPTPGLANGAISFPVGDRTKADSPGEPEVPALPPELLMHPRYRVLSLLGSGGMGAVYKAEHRLMERCVAVKVMAQALVASGASVDRFRREVKSAARLSHANIVTAHDAEQAGNVHFLVMEYVEGIDLARWLTANGPLPATEACDYVRQAAAGLQHAHEHGMIHRDIKPHNLMRTPSGVVKILDFGLARLAAEAGSHPGGTTAQGTVLGTVDYMAPEQANDAHQADIRSDIYSLGCTLYHLLSGRPPFPQGTIVQKIMAHTERQPQSLLELRPDLPPGLARVVERMMGKLPERRYQTPAEVCAALEPFASATAVLALDQPPARPTKRKSPQRFPPRPRRWPIAVALLLLFSALIAGGIAVYRIQTDYGELVITTDNPDVEVIIKQNGKLVRIIDTKTGKEVRLDSGKYELELKDKAEGLKLTPTKFTISRGKTVIATVERLSKSAAAEKIVEVRRFKRHTGLVADLAFSRDGKLLISVSADKSARLWEPATGKERAALEGHDASLLSVAISRDGHSLATSDWDGVVKVWNLTTGKEGKSPGVHNKQARGLAFSPDGKVLYSGGADEKVVRVWELASGKLIAELDHPNAIRSLALSPDGKVLAVATFWDGAVKLWDVATHKELRTLEASKSMISALTFSPDSITLFTGGADRVIRRWDVASGKLVSTLEGGDMPLESLALSRDGNSLISAGGDWRRPDQPGAVNVWDLITRKKTGALVMTGGDVYGVAIAPDGGTFATGEYNGDVRLWRLPSAPPPLSDKVGEVRRFHWGGAIVQSAAFSPNGVWAVSGDQEGGVRLVDLRTGKEVRRLPAHTGQVLAVAFSPDGSKVISAGTREKLLRLSDVTTGKELRRFEGHEARIAFSADGRQVLCGDWGGGLRLLDVESGKELQNFQGHMDLIHAVAFAPDGKTAASACRDNTIRFWNLQTGKEERRIDATAECVSGVAFAPDGKQLLSSHFDGTLRWWDVATGKELRRFAVQTDTIQSMALSPDGRFALTGGGADITNGGWTKGTDFTVRLWDVVAGKEVHRFEGHQDIVTWVTLSRDGRHALSCSHDGSMRLWCLPKAPPKK